MAEHGKWTAILGRRLREDVIALGNTDLEVYFDHGEEDESPNIIPFFGTYGTDTTVSHLDIAVVSKSRRAMLAFAELEEEGAKPKVVIGDIVTLFIAERARIDNLDYTLNNGKFLLGVRVAEKTRTRDGRDRNYNAKKKISNLERLVPAAVKDERLKGISVKSMTESDYNSLVHVMEKQICEWVNIPMVLHAF